MSGNTYPEIFPPGTRIRVRAGQGQGSDCDWNGHTGTIVEWWGMSMANIRMDKWRASWAGRPYTTITCHNLEPLNDAAR